MSKLESQNVAKLLLQPHLDNHEIYSTHGTLIQLIKHDNLSSATAIQKAETLR